jgi:choline dehydrogenase
MTDIPEEWKDPDRTPLDFIVVGAGAGGAPLAARLVERGYTVLVVEMGPEKPPKPEGAVVENTEVPLLHTETTEDERHSLRFFVKHFDDDPDGSLDPKVHRPENARRDEKGIFYPRAQGIGGCTIHNAMITICGLSEDWDEIAEATEDESWRGERMRPYFQRVERCHYARPSLLGRLKGLLGFGTGWENARHGYRGWLDTTLSDLRFLKRDRQLLRVVLGGALASLRAGVEQFGELVRAVIWGRAFPSLDPNHWEKMRKSEEGISRIPCAITPGGERSDARARLLDLKKPDSPHGRRLHLLTKACVTEVVLAEDSNPGKVRGIDAPYRAKGVRYLPREHVYEADPKATVLRPDDTWREQLVTLYCRREVILSGGAFNTPQLLMLSGIGPAGDLRKQGLTPRVDLPGVGQNLQDRYEVPVVATVTDRFRSLDGIGVSSADLDPELKRWIDNAGRPAFRRGLYATNGGLVGIFIRSGQEDAAPDLFIFALAGHFPGYYVGYSKPAALNRPLPEDPPRYRRALTWLILKARTRHHKGCVQLQSKHPFQRPVINFRSFPLAPDQDLDPAVPGGPFPASKDQDLEALYQGICFVRTILDIGKDKGTIADYQLPGYEPTFGGNVRKWIKHVAWGHHACGTCRIGDTDDEETVLDSRFRVRGVKGLRVVDASVFPRIPGFFIVANVYVIAEKAADVLTEDNPIPAADLPPEATEALKNDPVLPSSLVFEARRLYPTEMEAAEARLIVDRRRAAGL